MGKKSSTDVKQSKVQKVMREFKRGDLTTNGRKVTDRDQALAIALAKGRAAANKKKGKKK